MVPKDVFHLVLQPELLLLDLRFFELFRFGEEVAGQKFVQPFVELVVPGGKVTVFVIRLQQALFQFVRIDSHMPPPCRGVPREIRRKIGPLVRPLESTLLQASTPFNRFVRVSATRPGRATESERPPRDRCSSPAGRPPGGTPSLRTSPARRRWTAALPASPAG